MVSTVCRVRLMNHSSIPLRQVIHYMLILKPKKKNKEEKQFLAHSVCQILYPAQGINKKDHFQFKITSQITAENVIYTNTHSTNTREMDRRWSG